MDNRWEVAIKAQIQLKTGIYAIEKNAAQPVEVEVLAQKKIIPKTFINYEILWNEIQNLQQCHHRDLLEEWAIFLARQIFEKTDADFLKITMQKLAIFEGRAKASVALFIAREECLKIAL